MFERERMSGANVFVIFPGTRASSSRCSKELGERLFKHARLKVSAFSPSRTYYLGTSIGSFVHAADELHHAEKESDALPSSRRKKHHSVLMGTQLRVKNPCIPRRCVSKSNYNGERNYNDDQFHVCCANTPVTL